MSQIRCETGKCSILRATGDANHSHDGNEVMREIRTETLEEKSTYTRPFYIIIGFLVLFALFVYVPIQEHVSAINSSEIFTGILTASATIFAISFTVSQFLISRLTDTYSPYLVKIFSQSRIAKTSFFSLLITTVVSMIFLGVDFTSFSNIKFLDEYWSGSELMRIAVYCTVISFIFSIAVFSKYFILMTVVTDPILFSSEIRNRALSKLREGKFDEFENIMVSIGDIISKSQDNGQTRIANQYIREITSIMNGNIR